MLYKSFLELCSSYILEESRPFKLSFDSSKSALLNLVLKPSTAMPWPKQELLVFCLEWLPAVVTRGLSV